MKNALFLALMALAVLHPLPETCWAQLIHETGSDVTFDSATGQYWYYDITRFSDMTYDEQIQEIATVSVQGFTGTWRMALEAEMQALWENSAQAIFSSFALTMNDDQAQQWYTLGRYDERFFDQEAGVWKGYFAHVERTAAQTYEKSVLNYLDIAQDHDDFEVLGAWVVFQGEPPARAATTVSSILGNGPRRRLDQDMFTFNGTKGESVTLTLGRGLLGFYTGKKATLKLKDQIRRVRFSKADKSALPNQIRATLPKTGKYAIWVQEQRNKRKRFNGEYRLTLESSQDAWMTLQPTSSVE
jgi:hypothetical protein